MGNVAKASPTMLKGCKFRIAYQFKGWRIKGESRHETRGVEIWIQVRHFTVF
jgi:hypothetical protein